MSFEMSLEPFFHNVDNITCSKLINQKNTGVILLKESSKTHTMNELMKPGVQRRLVSHHKASIITKFSSSVDDQGMISKLVPKIRR